MASTSEILNVNSTNSVIEEPTTKINLVKKFFDKPLPGFLVEDVLTHQQKLDTLTKTVEEKIDQRKENAPISLEQKTISEKKSIEKRLEESDVALSELIQFGNELVTNVKVANEKREILRRNFEAIKRENLLSDLEKESIEAIARFDQITSKWFELGTIKEPMGLYEELEAQKERMAALMKQKDEIIKKCQTEITRVDVRYDEDQKRQSTDIYTLVERVDSQIELIKKTYNKHLDLLQGTIEDERQNLAMTAARKWTELYDRQVSNETSKFDIQREKEKFYNDEIDRITREQEELTRATRIRLERDAETLQLELRSIRNNVLMNSEKLDYNYQVLQKRNEENLIIGNQQKRRVAKINETISTLKRKIRETKSNSESVIKKFTKEVVHLHSSITELEAKSEQFRINNEKKYNAVWDINYEEATELLNKVLDIDKILHEQQLGLEWKSPEMPSFKKIDLPSLKNRLQRTKATIGTAALFNTRKSLRESKTDEQKLSETRLLRNILRKTADRGGFLVEEKLMKMLEPYSEEAKSLVRIDNIFCALKISNIEDVQSLNEYFLPFAWCPNCSTRNQISNIEKIYRSEFIEELRGSEANLFANHENAIAGGSPLQEEDDETGDPGDDEVAEMEKDIAAIVALKTEHLKFEERKIKHDTESENLKRICHNHYLVIEPTLVLTALRMFCEKHLQKQNRIKSGETETESSKKGTSSITKQLSKKEVHEFWSQFDSIIPEEKQKLWSSLEHGLKHYLIVLREREKLDSDCEFLRQQNAELQHLLQKYLPDQRFEDVN